MKYSIHRLVAGIASLVLLSATLVHGDQPGLSKTNQDRLRDAVDVRDHDRMAKLLAQGVNPNSDQKANLLALAASRNDAVSCKILLKAGTDVNRDVPAQNSALAWAASMPDAHVFDLIMAAHPTVNHDNSEDAFYCVYEGLSEWYQPIRLLDPKTNPKAGTALAEFMRRLQVLRKAGFDINAADDKTGETVLMAAVKFHVSIPVLQKLLDAGAHPAQRDKLGKSATDLAIDEKEIDVARVLDTDHSHSSLLHEHDIPAGSPFIGSWNNGDYEYLELKTDGSGISASMFGCNVAWKQSADVANLEFMPMKGNWPNGVTLKGTAHVTTDGKTLKVELIKTGSPGWTEELSRSHN